MTNVNTQATTPGIADVDVLVVGAGFAGLYRCKNCAGWASRCGCRRPPTTSAASGTGTAIPGRAATSLPPTTHTASNPELENTWTCTVRPWCSASASMPRGKWVSCSPFGRCRGVGRRHAGRDGRGAVRVLQGGRACLDLKLEAKPSRVPGVPSSCEPHTRSST